MAPKLEWLEDVDGASQVDDLTCLLSQRTGRVQPRERRCHLQHWRRVLPLAGLAFLGCIVGYPGACRAARSLLTFPKGASQAVSLSKVEDNCEAYFKGFHDCTDLKYWECNGDDGSWAYRCCCIHGFGDFSASKNETTGMISLSANHELCLDVSTPYAQGEYYTAGPFQVQVCAWGNTNKQFHMQRAGSGQIHWAGHPALCMAVEDGPRDAQVKRLKLAECEGTSAELTQFSVTPGQKQISLTADPSKCVRANEVKGGALMSMAECNSKDPNQHLEIMEPSQMPTRHTYPTLFCLSLMLPFGSEVTLMRQQFERQIGIFQCRDFAIFSNTSMNFTKGNWTFAIDVMPGSLAVAFGGHWHNALNRDIFIRFWSKVVHDNRAWRNSFTVKLDPDTVFFAARLQQVLVAMWKQESEEEAVFLNNCHNFMHGPIEVISKQALKVYKKRWGECRYGWPYKYQVEDVYYWECWKMLGIKQVDAYNVLMENKLSCEETSSTRDGRHPCFSKQVSFHPFKTTQGWWECYRRGNQMTWATPFLPVTEVPNDQNYHHA